MVGLGGNDGPEKNGDDEDDDATPPTTLAGLFVEDIIIAFFFFFLGAMTIFGVDEFMIAVFVLEDVACEKKMMIGVRIIMIPYSYIIICQGFSGRRPSTGNH